jgi:hypothetical protein
MKFPSTGQSEKRRARDQKNKRKKRNQSLKYDKLKFFL